MLRNWTENRKAVFIIIARMSKKGVRTVDVKETPENARIGAGKPGPGRPKGSANKLTKAFRESILTAYEGIGGDDALIEWARANPTEFYKIASRLIPTEAHISGPDGKEIPHSMTVSFVDVPAR